MTASTRSRRWRRGLPREDLGNQMRGLLNRRQRAAGQPDIVPYIPTSSPPRTAFTGHISANRQFVFADMSFARVRAISKKAATTMNNVVMTICAGALRPYLVNHGGIPDRPRTASAPCRSAGDLTDPWGTTSTCSSPSSRPTSTIHSSGSGSPRTTSFVR
ncbi:MAG TPA: hypothetical protein VF086_20260 [Propionibacteriaceae bacterium]